MTKLPLDETALTKLRAVKERIEVCDEQGRIVGYFEPSIYAGQVLPEFDDAEVARRMDEYRARGGYTTAQVLEHLRNLGEK